MTVELYELLKQYDDKLMSVANGAMHVRYCTLAMKQDIDKAHKELFGKGLTKSEMNCGHCLFNAIKRVALEYAKGIDKSKRGRKKKDGNEEKING